MLLCAGAGLHAQRNSFVDTGWESMRLDSVRPWSGFGIALEGNWQDSVYTASIEYPELVKIGRDDLDRWALTPDDIPAWPDVNTSIGQSHGKATLDAVFMPLLKRDGAVYAIASYKAVIDARRSNVQRAPLRTTAERYTHNSVLSSGKWVKIKISESGVYKITNNTLRSMGFKDPSLVRLYGYGGAVLPETNLQSLTDDLPEQPLWRENGYVLFYAQGPVSWKQKTQGYVHEVNTYSDWGYYFLTEGTEPSTVSFSDVESDTISDNVLHSYPDYAVIDPDEYSWYRTGRRMFEAYDYADGGRTYKLSAPGIMPDSVGVTVAFSTSASSVTRLTVSVNGSETGVMSLGTASGQSVASVREQSFISRGQFTDESNIRLTYNAPSGTNAHLDFIRLNYNRKLAMYGPTTMFRTRYNLNNTSFCISNSAPGVMVWRIKDDGTAQVIPTVYSDGKTYTLRTDYSKSDILIAVNPEGKLPEPKTVGSIANQNLHGLDSIDMVIVVPASDRITAQAERLAQAHRAIDSISVAVVRADMVYNEFSSGTPDATALRRFMKMLYDRGGNAAPRYLLLMGEGAWDNRMHVSDWAGQNPDDYLLCYESYESLSHTASYVMEDYYGLLDDSEGVNLLTEKVDLGVGRIPVMTAAQAKAEVDQIIDYMHGRWAGTWTNRILVLGDDGDNNTHMKDANDLGNLYSNLYPDIDVRKIMWDAYRMEVSASNNGYPAVRKQLLEELDNGALIVNYSGHGSTEVLSHELVVSKNDMKDLKSSRLPFWITASCDVAPFDSRMESFGLNLVRNEKGGAIGILSTTRTVYASLNRGMNLSFNKYILATDEYGVTNALGDALRLAKNELVTAGKGETDMSENKLHYVLLGDPALRLAVPQLKAVVDSIGGVEASAMGSVAAGAVITVRGHIEYCGEKVDSFGGMLYGTVYDSERLITCYDNLKIADSPFQFKYRDRVLYSGSDSVRDGEFTLTFPVPMDINYSDAKGQIMLYGISNKGLTAHGQFDNFTVGGTATSMAVDTVGPSVGLYLNTPTFQYGASVNSTPLLVVELQDSSGINTSGNGLGHDLIVIVDNNPNWTWVLNGYYKQTPGDYTRGTVAFPMPELPEGKHTLMVRAWDMMNNSSTVYLGFKVVDDLKPKFTIDVTDSPARESTTLVITHDRPGQDANVSVQVADMNGTIQWTHSETDNSNSGVTLIQWNLHGNSGHRMQPGLYLIKATVGSGGESAQATCKLVIVGR
jgi:hypothetical protein